MCARNVDVSSAGDAAGDLDLTCYEVLDCHTDDATQPYHVPLRPPTPVPGSAGSGKRKYDDADPDTADMSKKISSGSGKAASMKIVAEGSFCKVFDTGDNRLLKLMPATDLEGLSAGQLRECNFYHRLDIATAGPQFIDVRVTAVNANPNSPLSTVVSLTMPKLAGDMWNLCRTAKWWSSDVMRRLIPILVRDIATALARLHSSGILHRDIKPCNFLTDKERFYLIDFGSANMVAVSTRRGGNCTYCFSAPEAAPTDILDDGTAVCSATQRDTIESDVYSFCASVFSMILRIFPDAKLYDWESKVKRITWPSRIPETWRQILLRGVSARPEERPTLAELFQTFCPQCVMNQQPLCLKTWPAMPVEQHDRMMAAKVNYWLSNKWNILEWIRDVCQKSGWSKLTFVTAVQLFYDMIGRHELDVCNASGMQLVATAVMSLAHKCLEDYAFDLAVMASLSHHNLDIEQVYRYEQAIWIMLEYVVTRRPVAIDFEQMSWRGLLTHAMHNYM